MNAWLVVLNWNGKSDTLELLDSLAEAELADTTVLVVDNGSSDCSLAAVEALHPWVRTLQTGANLGYAGGNNRGVVEALRNGAEVVGVLNNDTLVNPDFWAPLVQAASTGTVAVCPDIRYADRPDISWFFGGIIDRQRAWPRHLQPEEQPSRQHSSRTELLTGCCIVASAEVWESVGLFDERMFLIFEDSDWSMRARSRGCSLLLEPASVIRHKVSRSFAVSGSRSGLFYFSRNGLVFAHRWLGVRGAWTFLLRVVLPAAIRNRSIVPLFAGTTAAFGQAGTAPRFLSRLK